MLLVPVLFNMFYDRNRIKVNSLIKNFDTEIDFNKNLLKQCGQIFLSDDLDELNKSRLKDEILYAQMMLKCYESAKKQVHKQVSFENILEKCFSCKVEFMPHFLDIGNGELSEKGFSAYSLLVGSPKETFEIGTISVKDSAKYCPYLFSEEPKDLIFYLNMRAYLDSAKSFVSQYAKVNKKQVILETNF